MAASVAKGNNGVCTTDATRESGPVTNGVTAQIFVRLMLSTQLQRT